MIITLTNCCAEKREGRERELHLSQVSSGEDEDEIAIGWEKLACRMTPPPPPQHACGLVCSFFFEHITRFKPKLKENNSEE